MTDTIENVVIIGAGPAGLTCAIYAARSRLSPIIIAGNLPGGQLINTDMIENFPGFKSISGPNLMMGMIDHAESVGTKIIYETVTSVEKIDDSNLFKITLSNGDFIISKTVVIATGASHKHLNIDGEKKFTNKGVSWCATCDGPMYRGKKVAVVGGGNTALMEALFLSNFAEHVYIIHRRDTFRADKITQQRVLDNAKISIIWNSVATKIDGELKVSNITLKNVKINSEEVLNVDGVFIAIGTSPSSDFVKNIVELDNDGYIKVVDTQILSCNGLFAAGDVVSESLKQAIYAAGQGALAANKIEEYLGVR